MNTTRIYQEASRCPPSIVDDLPLYYDMKPVRFINDKLLPIVTERERLWVIEGSRGSGKSKSIAVGIVERMVTSKYFFGIGVRNVGKDIRDSIHKELIWAIETYFDRSKFNYSKEKSGNLTISYEPNGNSMIFRGMDDSERLKSVSEPSFVWIEEANQIELQNFKDLDAAVRTPKADSLEVMLSFNPVNESHWVYTDLMDSGNYTYRYIHSVLDDNYLMSNREDYKLKLKSLCAGDPNLYSSWILGLRMTRGTGGEYITGYSPGVHVMESIPIDGKIFHLSFDQNSWPYSTCLVAQIKLLEGMKPYPFYEIRILDEICLSWPLNTTEDVAKEFINRYGADCFAVKYTGDFSGNNEIGLSSRGRAEFANHYSMINDVLRRYSPEATLVRNMTYEYRKPFMRNVFAEKMGYGLRVRIAKRCSNLLNDIVMVKESVDGKMQKDKVKGIFNGVEKTYEKYGHCLNALEYLLCNFFPDKIKNR